MKRLGNRRGFWEKGLKLSDKVVYLRDIAQNDVEISRDDVSDWLRIYDDVLCLLIELRAEVESVCK